MEAAFVCDPNAYCVNDIMEAAVLALHSAVTYTCACRPGLAVGAMNDTLGYAPCSDVNECDSDDPTVNLCGPNAECINHVPSYDNETDTQGKLTVFFRQYFIQKIKITLTCIKVK